MGLELVQVPSDNTGAILADTDTLRLYPAFP